MIRVHPAHLVKQDSNYTFHIVLTQQGDLLTSAERHTELSIKGETKGAHPIPTPLLQTVLPVLPPGFSELALADLPDLGCQYQVVWQLSNPGDLAGSGDATVADPVYAELFDIILPGHPLWAASTVPGKEVLVRNRVGTSAAELLLESGAESDGTNLRTPIFLWCPTVTARPIYVVKVGIKILDSALFGDPQYALLQVQRDGYRSRPLPIASIPSNAAR